jgi:hypothetical protein
MTPIILRISIIIVGILLFFITFYSYICKKLNERITLYWVIFSILLILSGAVPAFSGWSRRISLADFIIVLVIFLTVIFFLFKLSEHVCILSRKNQELAMHVSLLNQENERILYELEQLTGKKKPDL